MAGYIENGFTRAVQGYLTIDLSVYVPLLCFFGLFVLACRHICKYLLGWLETYCTSTVYLRYREDAYDILMLWISSQSFAQNARSSLVTTDLASSLNRSRNDRSNGGDANKKTLYYTPWNGRFFMRYKGRLPVFRREYRAGEFSSREEVSISCFGRSPQILRELLSECCTESAVSKIRRISTVILDESKKRELLEDIREFLDPASQQWYSDRDIPYRRGYLLYGPPGTGKSSLSLSIAGRFGLDVYILSLSAISEASLKSLFAKLPSRCIILLEDIDAVSSNRDAETEDSRQIVTGSPSRMSESAGGKVSLSAILNVIDGVGSQGRILIMTTNHITRLDEALIRLGHVDKRVELGLADNKMTADLFCFVFKRVEGDVALPEDAQSGENRMVHEAAVSQREEAERIERLAIGFAVKVLELKFSLAEIFSFLLEHRKSPEEAIDNVEQLISKPIEVKSKPLRISEDANPEDTQPEIARDSKLVRL
ncbi:P-loop containing nucleoside triphosphate hydrolase protein [Trichophaea hybrida]|nr:P-loop containing nucleoside triphosphate hydrolase protein [Trichophaea hybrida]